MNCRCDDAIGLSIRHSMRSKRLSFLHTAASGNISREVRELLYKVHTHTHTHIHTRVHTRLLSFSASFYDIRLSKRSRFRRAEESQVRTSSRYPGSYEGESSGCESEQLIDHRCRSAQSIHLCTATLVDDGTVTNSCLSPAGIRIASSLTTG